MANRSYEYEFNKWKRWFLNVPDTVQDKVIDFGFSMKGIKFERYSYDYKDDLNKPQIMLLYSFIYSPNEKIIQTYTEENMGGNIKDYYLYNRRNQDSPSDKMILQIIEEVGTLYDFTGFPLNVHFIVVENFANLLHVTIELLSKLLDISDSDITPEYIRKRITTLYGTSDRRKIPINQSVGSWGLYSGFPGEDKARIQDEDIIGLFDTKPKLTKKRKENDKKILQDTVKKAKLKEKKAVQKEKEKAIEHEKSLNELKQAEEERKQAEKALRIIESRVETKPENLLVDDDDFEDVTTSRQTQRIIPDFTFETKHSAPTHFTTHKFRIDNRDYSEERLSVDYHKPSLNSCPQNVDPLKHIPALLIMVIGNKKLSDAEKFRKLLYCIYLRGHDYNVYVTDKKTEIARIHLHVLKEIIALLFVFCTKIPELVNLPRGNETEQIEWLVTNLERMHGLENIRTYISTRGRVDINPQIREVRAKIRHLSTPGFNLPIFGLGTRDIHKRFKIVADTIYLTPSTRTYTSSSDDINRMSDNIYDVFQNRNRYDYFSPKRKLVKSHHCKDCKHNLMKKSISELRYIAKKLKCKSTSKLTESELVKFIMRNC